MSDSVWDRLDDVFLVGDTDTEQLTIKEAVARGRELEAQLLIYRDRVRVLYGALLCIANDTQDDTVNTISTRPGDTNPEAAP